MMRLAEILDITQKLGDLVVGFGRKSHTGGMDMNYGDAFNDMPEEYREYRLNHNATVEPIGKAVDVEHVGGTVSFRGMKLVRSEEQSEADKAIVDGKPRWMNTAEGWRCVVVMRKEMYGQSEILIWREGKNVLDTTAYMAAGDIEILPYGESPPPAKSEKPEADANSENWESHEWAIRIRDIDKDPDDRWLHCTQCGVHSKQGNTQITSCSFFTNMDREVSREVECALAEGPMHPDMIRAELQKAHNEGYAVVGSLKNEFRFSPKDKFIKTVEGAVDEFGVDTATGQEWVTIGSGYGKRLYIIELASVKRMES